MTIYDPRVQGVEIPIVVGSDLNSLTSYGVYSQNISANATLALHYPATLAGILEVFVNGTMVAQRYSAYDSSGVWIRDYVSSSWTSWNQVYPPAQPSGDISLYKYAPQSVASFSFDLTHGIPTSLNTNQTYKIRGFFKSTAVSAAPFMYLRMNADTGANYTWVIDAISSATSTVTHSEASTYLALTTGGFPNGYMVSKYEIEILPIQSDYVFVTANVSARNLVAGAIWKFVSSGMYTVGSTPITSLTISLNNVTTPNTSAAELSTSLSMTY